MGLFIAVPPFVVDVMPVQEAMRPDQWSFILEALIILPLAWLCAKLLIAMSEKVGN